MFARLKATMTKQHIVPGVGATMMMITGVLLYISIVNFLLITLMSYQTSILPWALVHAPWLTLWLFILLLLCGSIIAGIIEYKFVTPSRFSFGNEQGYMHNSPLVRDMAEALKQLRELRQEIEKLKGNNE